VSDKKLPARALVTLACMSVLLLPVSLRGQSAKFDEFPDKEPTVGDVAPDFTLLTVEGEPFTLSEAYAQKPVVIEFGSYT